MHLIFSRQKDDSEGKKKTQTLLFFHSDAFVRSPAGASHYYHSTAASRKLVGQTSSESVGTSPTEGTNANIVSNRVQSLHYYTLLCFTGMY